MGWPAYDERQVIRDSYGCRQERRTKPDGTGEEFRIVTILTRHYELSTWATIDPADTSFEDYVEALLTAGTIINPSCYFLDNETGNSRTVQFLGTWSIDELTIDDHGNGTTTVRETLSKTGDWT